MLEEEKSTTNEDQYIDVDYVEVTGTDEESNSFENSPFMRFANSKLGAVIGFIIGALAVAALFKWVIYPMFGI